MMGGPSQERALQNALNALNAVNDIDRWNPWLSDF